MGASAEETVRVMRLQEEWDEGQTMNCIRNVLHIASTTQEKLFKIGS